ETSELTIGDRFISLSQYQAELKKKNNALNDIAGKTNSLIKRTNNLDKTTAGLGKELIESNKIISQQQQLIEDALRRIKELENGTDPERPIGKIIDVSEHQGQIDWVKVKADDIELAIIRVQDGSSYVDNYYRYNIQQCQQLNITYAVYAFARYVNEADAGQEATDFYNRTKSISGTGKQPLFYMIDVEVATMENMRQGTEAWQNKMISFGISQTNQVAYIANHLYDQFNINVARFGSIVIPAYRSTPPDHPWDLWQYSDKGSVQGINGNVDVNKDPSERFKKQYLGR
ncbi:GH25 family lysozyme, partial [Carnobacterium divergens]